MVADGDISDAEVEWLDRLAVHEQLGLAQRELHALLDTFCEDLLSSDQLEWADACPVDERALAELMGEIQDPALRLKRSNPYYGLPGMAERLRRPDHPATVSWNDAQTFIRRLNQLEGHQRYRLPTEAEWEYAARAGTTTAYSFGDDVRQLGRHAWYGEDFASGSTHPVGLKLPNAWGLRDMHGNVWEWVQDCFDAGYYARSPAVDPPGPASGTERTVRGGSWHVTSGCWRSAFRKSYEPDY